jgi:cell division protein FtsN
MKKLNIILCAFVSAALFTGASVWEGSATVSSKGASSEDAYYAATDSFPCDTMVDVTNLENGRTIRLIVSAGLDSPGFLAMLSPNAAEALGIQTPGIGRIRMTQAPDPIAYSRFTDGRESPEGYVPRQSSGEDPSADGSPARTVSAADSADPSPVGINLGDTNLAKIRPAYANPEDSFYSDAADIVSPAGVGSSADVVIPAEVGRSPANVTSAADGASPANRREAYIAEPVDYPADGADRVEPTQNWVSVDDAPGQRIAEVPSSVSPRAAQIAQTAQTTTQVAQAAQTAQTAQVGQAAQDNQTSVTPPKPGSAINLIPAEERPPQGDSEGDKAVDPDSRFFVESIVRRPQTVIPFRRPQAVTPPRQPVSPPMAVPPAPTLSMVAHLEKGKYYVQIGAFNRSDSLEAAAVRLNRSYPLTVQSGGSPGSIVYRLFIGPLTEGESAATLQTISRNGYPDAFVRTGL